MSQLRCFAHSLMNTILQLMPVATSELVILVLSGRQLLTGCHLLDFVPYCDSLKPTLPSVNTRKATPSPACPLKKNKKYLLVIIWQVMQGEQRFVAHLAVHFN